MIFTGSCTQPAVDFMAVSCGIPPSLKSLEHNARRMLLRGKKSACSLEIPNNPKKKKHQCEHEKPRTQQDLCFFFLDKLSHQ